MTLEQETFIRENSGEMLIKDISKKLGVYKKRISQFIKANNLPTKSPKNRRRLNKSEEDYIRQNYGKMMVTKIAKHIGVSDVSVWNAISRLGLTKNRGKECTGAFKVDGIDWITGFKMTA